MKRGPINARHRFHRARLGAGRLAAHIGGASGMIVEACAGDPTADDLASMAGIARQLRRDAERLERALSDCRTLVHP